MAGETIGGGAPGDALIWGAYIDDHTVEFFAKFDRSVDRMASRSAAATKKVDVGSKKSAAGMGLLAGAIGGVTMQLASMGIKALGQFKQLITSSIQLAARAETLAISLNVVGANAGYTQEQMAEFEEGMMAMGITTIQTRQALMKMSQASLDLTRASELARVAQDAAVIAGTNSSECFGRMLHGITTLNSRILRHAGIVVNLQAEYKKYAAANNMVVTELDTHTKQQIAMNAVIEAGARIAGTYEAAMGTAGKQAGSMARHQEELQLAIGKTFQPAYLAWIQFMTENLKKMRDWFEENKDTVADFGATLGYIVKALLTGISALVGLLMKIPEAIKNIAPIFKVMSALIPDFDERWANLGVTFRQTIVLITAGVTIIVENIKGLVEVFQKAAPLISKAIKLMFTPIWEKGPEFRREVEETKAALLDLGVDMLGILPRSIEKSNQAAYDTAVALNLIKPAAEDAADGLNTAADAIDYLAEEMEASIPKIEELNKKFAEELAQIAIRRARDEIENEIRTARRIEDLERQHQERLEDIAEDAAKQKQEILRDATDEERELFEDQADERLELEQERTNELLDIEINYRRTLEGIQEDFDYQASEIARRNDAVALARLIRGTARRISDAEKARDQNRGDAQSNYIKEQKDLKGHQAKQRAELRKDMQERLEEYQRDLQERLEDAARQRDEDYEDLHRNLVREREDQQRHYAYEDEDRARAHENELKDLGAHFASMEHMTEDHAAYLLDTYGASIESLDTMWDEYYGRQELRAIAAGAATRPDIPVSVAAASGLSATDLERMDPYTKEWMGLAEGGIGLATSPTTIMVGEQGPEVFGAIPLSQILRHDYNFHIDDWSISGVTPAMEADLKPVMMGVLKDLARGLKEGRGR